MKEKIILTSKKIFSNYIVKMIGLAFLINLFCDILNQRSLISAFSHLFTNPLNYLFNMLLILITISLSGLFKKQKFALVMLSFPWIGLAIANFIVQCCRNTPLSFVDILLIPSVFTVFNSYLNIFHWILIFIGVSLMVFGIVMLYKKENHKERIIKPSIITSCSVLIMALLLRVPFIHIDALSNDYSSLIEAYQDYGLPYCFVVSVVDRGVHQPKEYNKELIENNVKIIDDIINNLENTPKSKYTIDSEQKPNVIFLQLESFMDANNLKNFTYSTDPNPYFTYLKQNYPSGYLTVPTFGSGTANVEFEIMSGLSLNNFGAGTFPYNTVLTKQTTETIAYTLGNNGYFSTIIHNNRASFYDREDVFPNMGYDRFVSSEVMTNLESTAVGWYKDKCLSYEIMKALKSTEQTDFIYTITVQPHGKYLTDLSKLDQLYVEIESSNKEMNKETINKYTYYVNQLYEEDLFIKDLITQINNYNEPVMLVMYGDHLPHLDITNEDLISSDIYKSEYVIYTNYEFGLEDKDLMAYQLSSHIMESIGCDEGIINRLHQTRDQNENYAEALALFTYDIFEDENYLWNKNNPYLSKKMQLGYDDIQIYDVINNGGGKLTIIGANFNDSSRVYFGKIKQETKCIDSNTLTVDTDDIDRDIEIVVKQLYQNKIYSESNKYIYKYDDLYLD